MKASGAWTLLLIMSRENLSPLNYPILKEAGFRRVSVSNQCHMNSMHSPIDIRNLPQI